MAASGRPAARAKQPVVALWDLTVEPETPSFLETAGGAPGWDGYFNALDYRPDGNLLVGASDAGLQLWDALVQERIGGVIGPTAASDVVATPDGALLVSGDDAGVVQSYPATIEGWRHAACTVVSRNLTRTEWADFIGEAEPYHETCPEY